MGKFMVTFSDEAEKLLRDFVYEKYGSRKGALGIVMEEAVRRYLNEQNDPFKRACNPDAVRTGKDGSRAGPLILGRLMTLAKGSGEDAEYAKERLENYGVNLAKAGLTPRRTSTPAKQRD